MTTPPADLSSLPQLSDVQAALTRVRSRLPMTPCTYSAGLSELVGKTIYCKWDHKFRTGSFKERGALNFLLALEADVHARGVCAASAGNHALALSYHAAQLRVPCLIVMPTSAPLVKVQATEKTGAEVILKGTTFDEAYEAALKLAEERKMQFVPAFDHPLIIAGQGTAALEILEQYPALEAIVVPVGGGGLISGIAIALKALKPSVQILGVQSEWAVEVKAHPGQYRHAKIKPTTIADGIAVKRVGKITQPIIKSSVDQLVAVSEAEIADGIMQYLSIERTVIEGAAAAGLAALLAGKFPQLPERCVLMACGGNIDMNVLSRLIERDMAHHQRHLRAVVSVPDRPGSLYTISGIIAECGANVLEVLHNRSFSHIPGHVDITFLLEVRDAAHRAQVLQALHEVKLSVRELDSSNA
ncbi:MAG: threonine ammonia-lyase [Bdellovibrionota bacterium]|nr:MAG: threonine ammonia-lyase [Bdellovibrionota bacterium]